MLLFSVCLHATEHYFHLRARPHSQWPSNPFRESIPNLLHTHITVKEINCAAYFEKLCIQWKTRFLISDFEGILVLIRVVDNKKRSLQKSEYKAL